MNFFGFGANELIVVAIILIALFGTKKMTEIARGLGESTKEIKKVKKEFDQAVSEQQDTITSQPEEKAIDDDTPPKKTLPTTKSNTKGGAD